MQRLTFASTNPVTDLAPQILAEIGKTMVLFANLEWRLSRFAYALLGVDRNLGRIAVREPRAQDRFDMVCDLLAYREIAVRKDRAAIRQMIADCEEKRNLVAHSVWVREPKYGTTRLVKTSGHWQPTPKHPPKTKRKTAPEAVEFELEDAIALNEKLQSLIATIEKWAESIATPAS